jgi:hypothetical protein
MARRVAVTPVETVADTPEGLLEYLVRRTAVTIGTLVDRSDAVIVGEVVHQDPANVPVPDEDIEAVQPWLSSESGAAPHIVVVHTLIRVADWLVGASDQQHVRVVHVPRRHRVVASDDDVPVFTIGDSGLLFLLHTSPSLPYASYLSGDEFQLAPGETGVRSFNTKEVRSQSGSLAGDRSIDIDESIEAIRWYVSARGNIDRLRAALNHHNHLVVHHAIRELALNHVEGTAERFVKMSTFASGDLRLDLMLGLWIVGEQEAARSILDGLLYEIGVEAFLAQWELKHSLSEDGERIGTLFGPRAEALA